MPRIRDVFFNDNDKGAAGWLRNAFPRHTIDQRSINDLEGADLADYRRVHLFAGIGGWQLARWLMGFPEGWSSYADMATPSSRK